MSAMRPASDTKSDPLVRFKIKGACSECLLMCALIQQKLDITILKPPKVIQTFMVKWQIRFQCNAGKSKLASEWAEYNQEVMQWRSVDFELYVKRIFF
jgi:hypothetical protein